MIKRTPWQLRAMAVGLDQETIRRILKLAKSSVSRGMTGKYDSGVPQSIKATVLAWEIMTPEQREEWLRLIDEAE